MTKRILGLILALCLVVGLLPMAVFAAQPNGRFYYLDYGGNSRVGNIYVTMKEGMTPVYLVNRTLTAEEVTTAAAQRDGSNTSSTAIYTRTTTETPTDNYIKLEYPTGGVPTVTLHNVTIKNLFGISLGYYKVNNSSNANYVGSTDYRVVLEGNNTIANTGSNYAALKANTSGDVTITGDGTLNLSGNFTSADFGVLSTLGNLVLDNTDVTVTCPETTGKAHAISATAGNITVKGGSLTVNGIDNPNTYHNEGQTTGYGRNAEAMLSAIKVGKTDLAVTSDTTAVGGDLTIQDGANVKIFGSPYKTSLLKIDGAFNIINSDVEMGLAGALNTSTMLTATPTLTYTNGYTAVASATKCGYDAASNEATAPAATVDYAEADAATYQYFKVVHNCFSAADDKDCTTANTCDVCGTSLGAAQTAHTPAADDGDCTTPIKCTNAGCEQIVTAGATAHTPAADDNDCSTDTVCTVCGKVTTPAPGHKPADRDSCDVAANCTVCGKEALKAGAHAGGTATCKEKAKCTECGKEYGELADHTGGTATCKDKAICTVCNQAYGELSTVHTPEADDKDCTTAVKCSVCGNEAIAAKTHAFTNGVDTTCDNEGCEHTRVVEPKPVFSVSFGTNDIGDNISSGKGKATVIMNAGDAAKYYANYVPTAEAYAKNSVMKATTDTANWNMKIEYPADGVPTVTLKNAIIDAKYGILFGGWDAANEGPVKLVLEGENIIAAEYSYKSALQFLFKGDKGVATIQGPGKLLVSTNCHGGESSKLGAVYVAKGSLILDNANLTVLTSEEWGCSYGISVEKGDMTVKGGSVKIVGYDDSKTTHYADKTTGYNLNANAIYAGIAVFKTDDAATNGNLTVEDGAKVTVAVSICKNTNNPNNEAVVTQGKFTIKDSEVEIALIGKCLDGAKLFLAKPTLEYKDGAYTVTATKTKKATPTLVAYDRDQYTKDMTALAPDTSKVVDWAETTSLGSITYFKVVAGGSGAGTGTGGNTGDNTGSGTGTNTPSNPNTGDVSILLTAAIALSSAVGFAGVTVLRKKEF